MKRILLPGTEPGQAIAEPAMNPAPAAEAEPASPSPDAAAAARPSRARRLRVPRAVRWAAAALLAILLLALAFRPTPVEVEVALAVRGPLETTVDAEGMTRVRDRYQVAAPVTGHLERIALREGDPVEAGAVIARITPLPLDAQTAAAARSHLAGAEAALQEASARAAQAGEALAQAERSTARIRAVAEAGAISVESLERAELQRAAAQRDHQAGVARSRAAASEVEAARAALISLDGGGPGSVATVRSPADGRVLRLHEQSERVVTAGTPLVMVGDDAGLEVVVDVLSTDAVRIQAGAPMRLVEWGGEGTLEGRVRRVEPAGFTKVSALGVEEQRVNVIGELEDSPAALGDGYRVEARIVTWQSPEVLKVPTSALVRSGQEWSAFVVEEGRARLRTLRIGHRGAAEAEVLEGISAGEEVILFPSEAIREGARVRVR